MERLPTLHKISSLLLAWLGNGMAWLGTFRPADTAGYWDENDVCSTRVGPVAYLEIHKG